MKMAIIQCHECKKDISETAEVCPSCGSKTLFKIQKEQAQKSKKSSILIVIGLVVLIFIGRAIYIEKKNQHFIDSGAAAVTEDLIKSLEELQDAIKSGKRALGER